MLLDIGGDTKASDGQDGAVLMVGVQVRWVQLAC